MGASICKLCRNFINPSSSSHATSNYEDWNDLPEEILTSIFTLLPSIADLACAASVSHPWNVAAVAASNNESALHLPPLILTTILTKTTFNTEWVPPRRCYLIPIESRRCYLIPIESRPTSKPYRSRLSALNLTNPFIKGHNFSKLILVIGAFIILLDVFSGAQIRSPKFASLGNLHIDFAMLTASLHSSSLSLVLVVAYKPGSPNYYVFSWEPNGNGSRDGKLVVDMEIVSFALVNDQVYFVDWMRRVGVVEFEPKMSCNLLPDISMEKLPISDWPKGQKHKLVECDGELLIVLFSKNLNSRLYCKMKIEAYKLDLVKRMWVKKEKLNNWCLFINITGRTGFSCKDPERWGGRSNCIYVHAPRCAGYDICTLNEKSALSTCFNLSKCPYPLWVYPSIKSVEKVGSGKLNC